MRFDIALDMDFKGLPGCELLSTVHEELDNIIEENDKTNKSLIISSKKTTRQTIQPSMSDLHPLSQQTKFGLAGRKSCL